jgi:hypothetical protein
VDDGFSGIVQRQSTLMLCFRLSDVLVADDIFSNNRKRQLDVHAHFFPAKIKRQLCFFDRMTRLLPNAEDSLTLNSKDKQMFPLGLVVTNQGFITYHNL